MQRHFYDSIVVGSGPAGSIAARALARNGASVLILEKDREVARNVVCAEGISKRSLTLFFEPDPRWISSRIQRTRFHSPSGSVIQVDTPDVGYILERKVFDRHLCTQALLEGAEILTGATYQSFEASNREIRVQYHRRGDVHEARCRLIVGADGPSSAVGQDLGIVPPMKASEKYYCAQAVAVGPGLEGGTLEIYFGNEVAPKGYAWVFPKGPGVANVGVGLYQSAEIAEKHLNFILDSKFPGTQIMAESKGVVPIGGTSDNMVGDRGMIVGDAARLADPVSGGGIISAMISGDIAGEIGARCLRDGDLSRERLMEYPERYWKIFGRDHEISKFVKEIWLQLEDGDVEMLFSELGPVLDGKNVTELDNMRFLTQVLKRSPKIMALVVKKGRGAFGNYIRQLVFQTA
jgi:digeranylgeranylglycerophospholipid reductase